MCVRVCAESTQSLGSLGFASLSLGPCQTPQHLIHSISRLSEAGLPQGLPRGGGAGVLGGTALLLSRNRQILGLRGEHQWGGGGRDKSSWLSNVCQEGFRQDLWQVGVTA